MTWNDHDGETASEELWAKSVQLICAQVNVHQESSTAEKAHHNQFGKTTHFADAGQPPCPTISVLARK